MLLAEPALDLRQSGRNSVWMMTLMPRAEDGGCFFGGSRKPGGGAGDEHFLRARGGGGGARRHQRQRGFGRGKYPTGVSAIHEHPSPTGLANNRLLFSAGDCTGPHDVVHLAVQQGEIAAHNIAHPDALRSWDERLVLAVIFIEPQVACVGFTEKIALSRKIPYLSAVHPFSELGKSIVMGATDGYVKLLAAPDSGEILGAAWIGPYGGDLIHEIVVGMAKQMTVHELAVVPHYHPTLAEIWTYPAAALAERIPR